MSAIEPNPLASSKEAKCKKRNNNTHAPSRESPPWPTASEGGSQALLPLGAPGDIPLRVATAELQTPQWQIGLKRELWGCRNVA